jgi:hypothetical protein
MEELVKVNVQKNSKFQTEEWKAQTPRNIDKGFENWESAAI